MKTLLLRSTLISIGLATPLGVVNLGVVNIDVAQAFTLDAQGYNLFVFGDLAQDTIHAQGKVAVGGNITSLPFPLVTT